MQAAQPIFNQPTQKITLDMGSNLLLGSQTKNSSPPAAMRPELKSTVFGMSRGDDGSGGSFGLPDQLPGDIRGIGGKGVTGDKQAVSFQQPGHPGQPRHGVCFHYPVKLNSMVLIRNIMKNRKFYQVLAMFFGIKISG